MYFMNDYLNELYFEKVAKKEDKYHTVDGILGKEKHPILTKKQKDAFAKGRPYTYAGLNAVAGTYVGSRIGERIAKEIAATKGGVGKAYRNSKMLRGGTMLIPAASLGIGGLQHGHHMGKAMNEYAAKRDIFL